MATFEEQVEGLAGLSIDTLSSPTQDELSQFLKDGVLDVTNRILILSPMSTDSFIRSTTSDSQGVNVGGSRIINVLREAGGDGSSDGTTYWRRCRKVDQSLQSRVVDIDSLEYASEYNPVYIMDNNHSINVYPTPSSNNGIKVFYINEEPRDISNDHSLIFSDSNIKYFPNDKVYLVVLYASIKALENALSNKSSELPDEISFAAPELETINGMNLPSVPVAPALQDNSVSFSDTAPSFDEPTVSPDFKDADNWINTEEDLEMLQGRVQLIGSQLQKYQADTQKSVQKMNKENLEYQANLQKAIQNAQLSSQDDAQALQKYSDDLTKYQAEVSKEVQRWQHEEYNKKFNTWQKKYDNKLQEYNANIQNYNMKVQKITSDYGWMEKRMGKLQQQYDAAFMLMQPKQQGRK